MNLIVRLRFGDPIDFRKAVHTYTEIADTMKVHVSTVYYIIRRYKTRLNFDDLRKRPRKWPIRALKPETEEIVTSPAKLQ